MSTLLKDEALEKPNVPFANLIFGWLPLSPLSHRFLALQ